MSFNGNTTVENFIYQGYESLRIEEFENCTTHTIQNKSRKSICCKCGGKLHIHDVKFTTLKDISPIPGKELRFNVKYNRYICNKCNCYEYDEIDIKYPNTRLTVRAVETIELLLNYCLSIKDISQIYGINWNVIKRICNNKIKNVIKCTWQELYRNNYKPKYLVVDEFAILKGHKYATCVMDEETKMILWIGLGKTEAAFSKFFTDIDLDFLSNVKAVSMDMNAAFNNVVKNYLPNADVVYDKFHMVANFNKDVIGSVRLNIAKKYQIETNMFKLKAKTETNIQKKRKYKAKFKKARSTYRLTKSSRWILLKKKEKLNEKEKERLDTITTKHIELGTCYSFREEIRDIYSLTNIEESTQRWKVWFNEAKQSSIEQLARFAKQKEKRIEGLIAFTKHGITTAKLEGKNNFIKLRKRVGFGFRDTEFFFNLLIFLSIKNMVRIT